MERNFRKPIAWILVFIMLLTTPGITVSAEGELSEPTENTLSYIPDADLPENDELFNGYVEKLFSPWGGVSFFGAAAGNRLTGDEKAVYTALVDVIKDIAAGTRTSTVFTIGQPVNDLSPEASHTFTTFFNEDSLSRLNDALLAEFPYEMYWFDKTEITSMGYYPTGDGKTLYLEFRFPVAAAYAGAEDYTTDPAKAAAATGAVAAAQAVVDASKALSDYEKLVAYRDYICGAVSYNDAAADPGYAGGYGDPWQLVYVFDGNPATKVVCEGYAKAFQYLSDLGGLTCYTVTGTMFANGTGGHMWNIVTLDGKNYLVDVTNTDDGSIGSGGELFMAGASVAEIEFTVTVDGQEKKEYKKCYVFECGGRNVIYLYDDDTVAFWGSDWTEESSESILRLYNSEAASCVHSNYINGVCSSCGLVNAVLAGSSLSLEGNIGLNFYFTIDEKIVSDGNAKVRFTANGKTVEVPVSQDAKVETMYKFTYELNAKQMSDVVLAQVVLGENTSKVYSHSVVNYADQMFANGKYSPEDIALVKAMLNYGAYAQNYFGYNTGALANAALADGEKDVSSVDVSSFGEFSVSKTKIGEYGTFTGANLVLESETTMNVFFVPEEGVDIASLTFKVGETVLTPIDKGSRYWIPVTDISSSALDEAFTITVSVGGEDQGAFTVSAFSYCWSVMTKGTTTYTVALLDTIRALYIYNDAANTYFQ